MLWVAQISLTFMADRKNVASKGLKTPDRRVGAIFAHRFIF